MIEIMQPECDNCENSNLINPVTLCRDCLKTIMRKYKLPNCFWEV